MSVTLPERDGDGYLLDMSEWTEEIGKAMAEADGIDMTEERWGQVQQGRAYYEEYSQVPPIRKFSKYVDIDKKELFQLWQTGPMKPITKYGGLPKPTGCV